MPTSSEITQLLERYRQADDSALAELMPVVYDTLYQLAERHLCRERSDHTLGPTALVHEAYLRLVNQQDSRWENRAQFFGIASTAMRHILVDHARKKNRQRRGGHLEKLSLDAVTPPSEEADIDLVALDEALTRLAQFDERKSKLVELRFFGGLSIEEAAEVLSISRATAVNDWRFAKKWLLAQISSESVIDD